MSNACTPRSSTRRDERGLATIVVMIMGLVLSLLAAAVLDFSQRSETASRHDQSWNGALAAAEAGIDDYLFRLNENANYWQYNAGNLPPDGNTAFSSWNTVAGGNSQSEYRYDVDASTIASDGRIRLTSTGRIRNVKRTVFATLRRRSFLDYLYFTDYETKDPASYSGSPFTAAEAQARCSFWWYGSSGSRRDVDARVDYTGDSDSSNAYCTEINFITADTINGPLHSNDAILVCGNPNFNGDTCTSVERRERAALSRQPVVRSGGPGVRQPDRPQAARPVDDAAEQLGARAETAVATGGCLYTGPTRIKLNSNGTMTVKSPFSKVTNNSPCPKNGTGALPTNGVIYVQNVPSTTTDPNYTNGCPYSVNGRTHPLGMPITNDTNTYGCRNGDVFIEGTLKGQLTVASENNVDVTWHLTYQNGTTGTDLLGLIANNYVEIYHPVHVGQRATSTRTSSVRPRARRRSRTRRSAPRSCPSTTRSGCSSTRSAPRTGRSTSPARSRSATAARSGPTAVVSSCPATRRTTCTTSG